MLLEGKGDGRDRSLHLENVNGRKATIMLEECGLEYDVHPIDISTNIQFSDDFPAINPNS